MRRKTWLAAGVLAVLTAVLLVLPASAHGGRHHAAKAQTAAAACGVCTAEDCHTAGRHTHKGVTYCGYDHADGVCSGSCAALCTVKGCTEAGRHVHNKTTYCGYDHETGFCDGTCVTALASASAPAAPAAGHHSHHHGHC